MKNIKYIIIAIVLSTAGTIFSSCKKESGDTEKPIIKLESPEEHQILYAGNDIHFEVEFSDNIELKSYKVDIHDNFDGHSHKKTKHEGAIWHFQQSWNFEVGKKNAHIHHHEIVIPTEIEGEEIATGDYHFMVYCTDAAGNESWTAREIEIKTSDDHEAPSISIIEAPINEAVFAENDTIRISGHIKDNEHLHGLIVAIMGEGSTNEQVNPTDCFAVMLHEHETVEGESAYDFSANITVGQAHDNNSNPKPINWETGNYYLIVKSVDESGNIGYSEHYPIIIN